MTENAVAILWYMLMAAAVFGFMVGRTCGEQVLPPQTCRRTSRGSSRSSWISLAQQASPNCDRQFKELRGVLERPAHKSTIVAVSKALQKTRPLKPLKINSRISHRSGPF